MWYESSWFVGVVSGVIASFSFFIILLLIKPKIRVSKKIAETIINGKKVHSIKIVNKSFSMLSNISYSLFLKTETSDNIYTLEDIPPRKVPLKYISRYSWLSKINSSRKKDDYAVRITYAIDTEKLDDKHTLVFTISANHQISGSTKVVKREYTLESINQGKFETGTSMRIN